MNVAKISYEFKAVSCSGSHRCDGVSDSGCNVGANNSVVMVGELVGVYNCSWILCMLGPNCWVIITKTSCSSGYLDDCHGGRGCVDVISTT